MSATPANHTDPHTGPRMLALYGHPFSSYTQKVLIALYENGTPFELLKSTPLRPTAIPPTDCATGRWRSFRCRWTATAQWWKAAS